MVVMGPQLRRLWHTRMHREAVVVLVGSDSGASQFAAQVADPIGLLAADEAHTTDRRG
jgi:cobalamin biosynthesis protein CbiG